jgi:hypothetical protein
LKIFLENPSDALQRVPRVLYGDARMRVEHGRTFPASTLAVQLPVRISAAPPTEKQFRLRDTMVCGKVYYNCVVHYVTIIIFIIIAVVVIKIINAVFRTA